MPADTKAPPNQATSALRARVGDLRQIASVRRIRLDEGPETGVSALAFSTGGGLDFWVMLDRAMDIGPLWRGGEPVAWQSPAGFRHPALVDPESDGGTGFGRGFSGFLMTCGLDHTRWALAGKPQHGRLSYLPARLLMHGEAWDAPEPHLFCAGEIAQYRHDGESLLLRRRIEAPIGGRSLRIIDEVENMGPLPQRHALLYHFNLGHPAIGPGTEIVSGGRPVRRPLGGPGLDEPPEALSVPVSSAAPQCIVRRADGAEIRFGWSAGTLPHLQLWHDPRPGGYVLGVEPITSAKPDEVRLADDPVLAPGERRAYALEVSFPA
jgi:hypothetical protein